MTPVIGSLEERVVRLEREVAQLRAALGDRPEEDAAVMVGQEGDRLGGDAVVVAGQGDFRPGEEAEDAEEGEVRVEWT